MKNIDDNIKKEDVAQELMVWWAFYRGKDFDRDTNIMFMELANNYPFQMMSLAMCLDKQNKSTKELILAIEGGRMAELFKNLPYIILKYFPTKEEYYNYFNGFYGRLTQIPFDAKPFFLGDDGKYSDIRITR